MKIIFALLFCFLAASNLSAQTEKDETATPAVVEISLARDDGHGNPGEATKSFSAADVPVHCSVELGSTRAVTVKMNFVVVAAQNLKPGKIIVSVGYKTNGKEDSVTFNASPSGAVWASGKYRVDILLDGKAAKSLDFEVKTLSKQTEKPATKPKMQPKVKQKQTKNSKSSS